MLSSKMFLASVMYVTYQPVRMLLLFSLKHQLSRIISWLRWVRLQDPASTMDTHPVHSSLEMEKLCLSNSNTEVFLMKLSFLIKQSLESFSINLSKKFSHTATST